MRSAVAAALKAASHSSSGVGGVHMTASAMAEGLVRERSLQSRTRVISAGAAGNPPCSTPTAALSERWPSTHLSL